MEKPISGIHHLTAIASNPQRNLDFYTEVLGLRLVKPTVNFDDPGTYHFYFADATGTPGTILTFSPGTTWSSWKSAIATLTTRRVSMSRRLAWWLPATTRPTDGTWRHVV